MMNDMLYSKTYIARGIAAPHGNAGYGTDACARPQPGNAGIGRSRGSDTGTGGDSLS
jgi:hypothetical protein